MHNIVNGKQIFECFRKPKHKKSVSKVDSISKCEIYKIKSNNSEISEKLKESKMSPSCLDKEKFFFNTERTPMYKTVSLSKILTNPFSKNNKESTPQKKSVLTIPRLDLKKIQENSFEKKSVKQPNLLIDCMNSQRSVDNGCGGDDGFLSQRLNDEYLIKNFPKKELVNKNESEVLQRDLSHILDKKKKINPNKFSINILRNVVLEKSEEKIIEQNFTFLNKKNNENKDDIFSELFEILEKDTDLPLFFILKEREMLNKAENYGISSFSPSINSDRFNFLGDFINNKSPHNFSNIQLNKLFEDLKKNHPNLFSNTPSGRKDVVILKEWLRNTLKLIFESNDISKKDKYVIADEAFNLCINELIRQISFDCIERGELMTHIWKNYLKLFARIFAYELKEKSKFEDEKENEYLKYTKMFRGQLAEKENVISELNKTIQEQKNEINLLKLDILQWKKSEQKNVEKAQEMKKINEQLFMKSRKLKQENEEIRFKLSKYREDSQKMRNLKRTTTMRFESQNTKFDSQNSFGLNQEEDSDKELNSELEDQHLKDIMKLLGENDPEDGENQINKDLDNPIIVKCFQEQKEKILFVKATEIDKDIRDSYFHNKGCQSDLNFVGSQYDTILTNEKLEEVINERKIKNNLLQFKIESPRRQSIKKFTDIVNNVRKKSSVVFELLNSLSPNKKSKLSSMINPKKCKIEIENTINNCESSVDSSRNENNDENEMNPNEKNNEIIEIKVDLPTKAKTVLEKRNSLIYELSKKIMNNQELKSSLFKNNDMEIKTNYIQSVENTPNNMNNSQKIQNKESSFVPIVEKQNNSINSFTETIEKENYQTQTENEVKINEKIVGNEKEIKVSFTPILEKEEKEENHFNFLKEAALEKSSSNNIILPSNPKVMSNKFGLITIKSKSKIPLDKDSESPKNNKITFSNMKSSTIMKQSTILPNSKNIQDFGTVSKEKSEILREKIKEQNAADFLANYLGSSIDKILENSNDKQPISVKIPKNIISNLNFQSYMENQPVSNEYDMSPNENEYEEELKNKILDLIQIFQIETQKNDSLSQLQDEIKVVLNLLLDFIKKLLNYIKEKSHLEKYEEFYKAFLELRAKIPKTYDLTYEQDLKENIRKKIMKKTRNVTKFFLVPKLGNQTVKTNVIDKENHPGMVITRKIKELGKFKNTNKLLHQKQALKLITQIYDEKLASGKDNQQNKELEMQIFSFNIFLNRYGIKKVAERKFTEFVLTIKNYSHIFRINVFAKMINILDSKVNYTIDEMKKYLEGFEYITEICTSGNPIIHDPADVKRYVPYIRGLDFIRVFSEGKLSHEEITELRKELDNIKENDPKNINKNGIIDLDLYLTKILNRYRHIMNRTKTYVVNAFNACDLDGNKMCNLSEFVLLYRHIENDKFKEDDVVKLFEEQADLITDSQKNMSFDKFTAICVDFQLFSDVQQIKYLGFSPSEKLEEEIQKKFNDLNLNWNIKKFKIDGKLTMIKPNLDKEDYENWRNILQALETRVLCREIGMEVKPILIAYKIMEDELERILKKKEEMEQYEEVDVEEDYLDEKKD